MAETERVMHELLDRLVSHSSAPPDPALVSSFCYHIQNEPDGPTAASRALVQKIQSAHEQDALQALTVLEECVQTCGVHFHAEIGKFRFLNELIKLVSPKYHGDKTPPSVRQRVIDLMYTWTVDIKHQTKIGEAYKMLEKQGVIKGSPTYMGAPRSSNTPPPNPRNCGSLFEDSEKSKLLQRLLQSKNPEDLQAANRLIKSIVKEDESRIDKLSRRMTELEVVANNVRVLNEMLDHCSASGSSPGELEVLEELRASCQHLRPALLRLASDADEKDDALNDILKASDDLGKVLERYDEVVKRMKNETVKTPSKKLSNHLSELMDLGSPVASNALNSSNSLIDDQLLALGISQDLPVSKPAVVPDLFGADSDLIKATPITSATTRINDAVSRNNYERLEDIFSVPTSMEAKSEILAPDTVGSSNLQTELLQNHVEKKEATADLFHLESFLKQSLQGSSDTKLAQIGFPQSIPKASLNELQRLNLSKGTPQSQSERQSPMNGALPAVPKTPTSPTNGPQSPTSATIDFDLLPFERKNDVQPPPPQSVDEKEVRPHHSSEKAARSHHASGKSDTSLIDMMSADVEILDLNSDLCSTKGNNSSCGDFDFLADSSGGTRKSSDTGSAHSGDSKKSLQSNCDIRPIGELSVALESVIPADVEPLLLYEDADRKLKVTINFTKNRPRPDVCAVVVSIFSLKNSPVKEVNLQLSVPKNCKLKAQAPSQRHLEAFKPFLPPSTITQVVLIANPSKADIWLKFAISYEEDGELVSEMGEIKKFSLH